MSRYEIGYSGRIFARVFCFSVFGKLTESRIGTRARWRHSARSRGGSDGTVHLVYFKGDPSDGDLFYATSRDGLNFSEPIRVNSVPGTAVAIGNIRGARIALGRNGNVYVVWNASPRLGNPALGRSPMLFSRLNAGRVRDGAEPYPYGVWNRRRRWNRNRSARPGIRVLACAHSRQARRRVSASVGDALRKRWQIF